MSSCARGSHVLSGEEQLCRRVCHSPKGSEDTSCGERSHRLLLEHSLALAVVRVVCHVPAAGSDSQFQTGCVVGGGLKMLM